jgi:hypothetical protein
MFLGTKSLSIIVSIAGAFIGMAVLAAPYVFGLPVSGSVNDRMATKIEWALRFGIRSFVVDSPGGSPEAGNRIAALFLETPVRVEVKGECFSACANFVFLFAAEREIRPGSLVAFHHSSIALVEYAKSNGVQPTDYAIREADILTELLRTHDLNSYRNFLDLAFQKVCPGRIFVDKCEKYDGEDCVVMDVRHSFWIPSERDFQAFGIEVENGSAPTETSEVAKTLSKLQALPARETFVFGYDLIDGNGREVSGGGACR